MTRALSFVNVPVRTGGEIILDGQVIYLTEGQLDLLVRLAASVIRSQPYATQYYLGASGNQLQRQVSRLRATLGSRGGATDLIETVGKCYRLDIERDCISVAADFSQLANLAGIEFQYWNVLDEWAHRELQQPETSKHEPTVVEPCFVNTFLQPSLVELTRIVVECVSATHRVLAAHSLIRLLVDYGSLLESGVIRQLIAPIERQLDREEESTARVTLEQCFVDLHRIAKNQRRLE